MGILSMAVARAARQKATTPGELESLLLGEWGVPTKSGIRVSPETAIRQATVFQCCLILSQDTSKLPLKLFRRLEDGGKEARDQDPLYRTLRYKPNGWQTSLMFRQMMHWHLLQRGNFFAYINWVGRKRDRKVYELQPLHPDSVTVRQEDDLTLTYEVALDRFRKERIKQENMLHVTGLTLDGVVGVSPITFHRETIGVALAAEKHGALLFGNGARPGGVLYTQKKLSDDAAQRIKRKWEENYSGDNAHRVAVLSEVDLKFVPISMTSADAQYLETRKFQRAEIAGLFRVPLHKINDLERATFSNIEHQSLEYVVDSLGWWLSCIEQALWRDLLTPWQQEEGYFVEHNVLGLLRGDHRARKEYYAAGRQWGWLSINDIRKLENMNPIPNGDDYMAPANMIPVQQVGQQTGQQEGGEDAPKA